MENQELKIKVQHNLKTSNY